MPRGVAGRHARDDDEGDRWISTSTRASSCFARQGIPVPAGEVAETPEEARAAAERIGGRVVVKAQVQVGGRGKAGGIKVADTPAEAEARARDILGMDIKGHTVHRVWIEAASDIAKEYYASVTFDRGEKKPLVMLSAVGGVDIEEVAASRPDELARLHIDPLTGFQPHHGRWLDLPRGHRRRGASRACVDILTSALRRLRRPRRDPARDQPAHPHRGRARPRARRQGDDRRQRARTATPTWPRCRSRSRPTPRSGSPRSGA